MYDLDEEAIYDDGGRKLTMRQFLSQVRGKRATSPVLAMIFVTGASPTWHTSSYNIAHIAPGSFVGCCQGGEPSDGVHARVGPVVDLFG